MSSTNARRVLVTGGYGFIGKAVCIIDLAKTVLRLSDRDLCIIHEPPREGEIVHSVADISKGQEDFGYAPKVVLEEGLQGLLLDRRGAAL